MDCLSVIADVVTLLGVPSIAVSEWLLWQQWREFQRPKIVSEDCLEFCIGRTAINLTPLQTLRFLPRQGDIVHLPGEGAEFGQGTYRIASLEYIYLQPRERKVRQPSASELKKVIARIERFSAHD